MNSLKVHRLMFIAFVAIFLREGMGQARWSFDGKDELKLEATGKAIAKPGPRAPEFPDFSRSNQAIQLDGRGSYMAIEEKSLKDRLDFRNGDAITIEAWVNPLRARPSQAVYVVGKGRTGRKGFVKDNQNWALRINGVKQTFQLSFLFASRAGERTAWHRWSSNATFGVDGWHHIAVTYHFGQPKSIRGWIDGVPTSGTWDLQGASRAAPVVDDDAVWVGSASLGNLSNSFHGAIDEIRITRVVSSDAQMASRFRRVGGPRVVAALKEAMPEIEIERGKVLLTFSNAFPGDGRWRVTGEQWPKETTRLGSDHFLLHRIPLIYDGYGVRTAWQAPAALRMAGDVSIPAGASLVLRTRSLSRLWLNGRVVARTDSVSPTNFNGNERMTPVTKPPADGVRPHGYHQQEVTIPPEKLVTGKARLVLETLIGGKGHRTESGEILIGLRSKEGQFTLLKPHGAEASTPLTNNAVQSAIVRLEKHLRQLDDENRRRAAATQNGYWKKRRRLAQHLTTARKYEYSASTSVDYFIDRKIDRAIKLGSKTDRKTALHFHTKVLPILRNNCFRCHTDKQRGDLRLDSRRHIIKMASSANNVVVPGNPGASELIKRVEEEDESLRMPPGDELSENDIAILTKWIRDGADWPNYPHTHQSLRSTPIVNDSAFARRAYLDTVGVPPSVRELESFLADPVKNKREQLINRLLEDDRFADHWVSYWLDVLAENPTLLNASLNSTGPFRWFLFDALRDRQPIDRWVTNLIMMRGGRHAGGSAGFAMAAENDAPFAAKGHILASAFQGIELQCARCHDSPYHDTTQRDLFSLAAMLQRKPIKVPGSSAVPASFFKNIDRDPLIQVTLKPNEAIAPRWRLSRLVGVEDGATVDQLLRNPKDSRERLAALITTPENHRFRQVIVNRVWKQLMGTGIVEPVDDWARGAPSHPDLLKWLGDELLKQDFNVRHVVRLIMNSKAYQRKPVVHKESPPSLRFFEAPEQRRMTAEQIVDSLHTVTSKPMNVEVLSFVHDGRRAIDNRLSLGKPTRAWMFASLNNERDRPSLNLPRAQTVADILQAFGWEGSRQKPRSYRNNETNVLQPGILANGTLVNNLTRVSRGSSLADEALAAKSPQELVKRLFLRVLGREPVKEELVEFAAVLAGGFDQRRLPTPADSAPSLPPLPLVTWFNHLQSEANTIQVEIERRIRLGPPPDPRLSANWREAMEDVLWSLINSSEFIWIP